MAKPTRYGLGQTYEILAMPYYALFYYRKATALRPYDSRMWCAMAGCYKQLGKKPEAIKCYQVSPSPGPSPRPSPGPGPNPNPNPNLEPATTPTVSPYP